MPDTCHPSASAHPLSRRCAGVLLHLSSLPGGKLGAGARQWIDFLASCGFGCWQILPLCPTDETGSPYSSPSAFAGNSHFIDTGFLQQPPYAGRCDLQTNEHELWQQAYAVFARQPEEAQQPLEEFIAQNHWLTDYALFSLLRQHHPGSWAQWPEAFRHRDTDALQAFSAQHQNELRAICFQQYVFYRQWQELKAYANSRDILILGDMPIFVAHDSSDCWANQGSFLLESSGQPSWVAGVPPDYFSETGQRWGNPQYDWQAMAAENFRWWDDRFRFSFRCYDVVRVDHFRGFEACWYIPATEELAINGHWREVPGHALFEHLRSTLPSLPIIAEDLGIITAEVEKLRDDFELPGMKILQFAFDGSPDNPYLPAQHIPNCVLYTGTHDNNTISGWFTELNDEQRHMVLETLAGRADEMPWLMMERALQSVANTVIIPLQDLLELDGSHRMNIPGTTENNWRWQFQWSQIPTDLPQRVHALLQQTQRVNSTAADNH